MNEKLEPLSCRLPNLSGKRWRILRQKLAPTFTSGKLKLMFNDINKCADDAMHVIRFFNKDEEVEARNFMHKFNLNVIGSVAFGLNINAFQDDNEESKRFFEHATNFFAPSTKNLLKLLLVTSVPNLCYFFKIRQMRKDTEMFFFNLVRDTVSFREKTGIRRNDFLQNILDLRDQELLRDEDFSHKEITSKKPTLDNSTKIDDESDNDLMEQLQNVSCKKYGNEKIFTENIIAAQSFVFISAGSESTAAVLSFALFEMATKPDIQMRLHTEIDRILNSQDFDFNAIREMTYMDQFLNEVQRLHPFGGVLMRECVEDYRLPGTNKIVEKGIRVVVPVMAIHKDPQYFPDPETFNPDRFQDMKAIPKGVFFPFGAGPRMCIAMRLAMLEMKIFLAKLLMEYTVILGEKTQVPLKPRKDSFVHHVVGGIWTRFEKRK